MEQLVSQKRDFPQSIWSNWSQTNVCFGLLKSSLLCLTIVRLNFLTIAFSERRVIFISPHPLHLSRTTNPMPTNFIQLLNNRFIVDLKETQKFGLWEKMIAQSRKMFCIMQINTRATISVLLLWYFVHADRIFDFERHY